MFRCRILFLSFTRTEASCPRWTEASPTVVDAQLTPSSPRKEHRVRGSTANRSQPGCLLKPHHRRPGPARLPSALAARQGCLTLCRNTAYQPENQALEGHQNGFSLPSRPFSVRILLQLVTAPPGPGARR